MQEYVAEKEVELISKAFDLMLYIEADNQLSIVKNCTHSKKLPKSMTDILSKETLIEFEQQLSQVRDGKIIEFVGYLNESFSSDPSSYLLKFISETDSNLSKRVLVLGINLTILEEKAVSRESLPLEQSNEKFNLAQKMAKIGSWSFHIGRQTISWTDQMYEIFGCDKNLGEPSFLEHKASIHKEDVEIWEKTVGECITKGTNYTMQFRCYQPDQSLVWVKATGQAHWGADNSVESIDGTCQDITEEILLSLENEKLFQLAKSLQRIGGIGGWEFDALSNSMICTEEVYRIFNFPWNKNNENKNFISLFSAKDQNKLKTFFEKTALNSSRVEETIELTDAIGSKLWIRLTGESLNSATKDFKKINGTLQDYSLRKKMELEIERSRNEIDKFFEIGQDLICVLSEDAKFVRVNLMFTETLGYSTEQILSKKLFDLLHPREVSTIKESFFKISSAGKPIEFRARMLSSSGSYYHMNWSIAVDKSSGKLYATAHDVTDMVRIQTRLEENLNIQKLSNEIFEVSNMSLQLSEKLQEVADLLANQYWLGSLGDSAIVLIQENEFELIAASGMSIEVETIYHSKAFKKLAARESLAKNEEIVFEPLDLAFALSESYHAFCIFGRGQVLGAIVFGSSKKEASYFERQIRYFPTLLGMVADLILKEKLNRELALQKSTFHRNSKLASLGELAAGVGHEINNPLAIAQGYLDMLDSEITADNPVRDMTTVYLAKIFEATDRIANIVKGLRTFAREDNNKINEFPIAFALSESVSLVQDIFSKEGIQVQQDLEGIEDILILGDRGKILQVVMNLISNAKDATEGMEDRRITLRGSVVGDTIKVEVMDNGCGIGPEDRDRVFDPFFSTKETSKGVGIGLSIAHSIVSDHEGSLSFTSELGKGAHFLLELPVSSRELKSSEELNISPAIPSQGVFRASAILVDDEEGIRDYVEFLLLGLGISVKSFESPVDALNEYISNQNSYDLIISDMKMPEMDGTELLKKIRFNRDIKQPKFVFITGGVNIDLEDKDSEIVNLIDGYLFKPFDEQTVFDVLQSVLKNEKKERKVS